MNVSAPHSRLALSLRPLSGSFDVDALGAANLSGGIVAGLAGFAERLGLASAQCEPPTKTKSESPKKLEHGPRPANIAKSFDIGKV